jgi:prepilin-type N-terminal cleavage/methylation domain-containing protein
VKSTVLAGERGESLVEVLVAVAVIAVVLGGFIAALSTGVFSVAVVRERVTAENLARAQLECIQSHPYIRGAAPISYTTACAATQPSTYPVDLSISYYSPTSTPPFTSIPEFDSGLQWITVTIYHKGEPVFRIEDYKAER